MLQSKTALYVLALFAITLVSGACSSSIEPAIDGDFVLNVYSGEDVIGAKSVGFDELTVSENRPILLNFWASNCPPCRAEMPALEAAWREHSDKVLFIGVDVGPYVGLGTFSGGRDLVEDFGITYVTGNTLNRTVVTDWQLKNMPSTFLLTPDGRVHDIVIGAISSSRISEKVSELIAVSSN